ncbi:hypothetical protein R3P38DRAFT_3295054 [Favolaschia claudopus]|uniref:Uncharacterized protein n=1 Tax=Favolaschia claudopus TaxID=2862362 RepID=A0AAV9ZC84_9AGAR
MGDKAQISSPLCTYPRPRHRPFDLIPTCHHSADILPRALVAPPFPPSAPTTPLPHSDRRHPPRNPDTDDADLVVSALRASPDSKLR